MTSCAPPSARSEPRANKMPVKSSRSVTISCCHTMYPRSLDCRFACSPTRHRLDPRATARAYGGSRASAEATPPTTLVQNATCVLAGAACCMVMAGPSMALDWNPETTARQGSSYTPAVMAAAPQISELFGSQAQDSFNDPVDPFTLYGTVLCGPLLIVQRDAPIRACTLQS